MIYKGREIDRYGFVWPKRPEAPSPVDECTTIEVELAKIYIQQYCKPLKNINRTRTSYGYKHDAEKWCGRYISSAAIIIAAIELGYEIEQIESHAYIAMTTKIDGRHKISTYEHMWNERGKHVPDKYQMIYSGPERFCDVKPKYPEYYYDIRTRRPITEGQT